MNTVTGTQTASVALAAGLILDRESREVVIHGRRADVTFLEFELLDFLISNPGRVFSRGELLILVWGYSYEGVTRTVDVHIQRLRRKLGPEYGRCLITVRRAGYRFTPPAVGPMLPSDDQTDAWLARGARAWQAALEPLTSQQRKIFIDTLHAYERELRRAGFASGVPSPS